MRKTFLITGIGAVVATMSVVGAGISDASTGHGHDHAAPCAVPSTPYPKIQDAVDATTCSVINVARGTYAESVTIPRSLTLNGARSGQDARSRRSGSESAITGSITVSADNVTVDGFTLNGGSTAGRTALIMQSGNSGETIQNNVFANSGTAASITTSKTTFRRNRVDNTATATDGFQANSVPLHDLTVDDNAFGGADSTRYNADVTVIEGNRNVTISDNRSNGDGTLIALFKTTGAQVTGNTVTGAGNSSAIYIGGSDSNVTVSGNTISAAGSAVKVTLYPGAGLAANAKVTITRNTLRKNQYGVNVAAGSTTGAVSVTRNTVSGNTTYGVLNDPASGGPVTATCNYWGSPSGPGQVGPGRGDKVSSGVTYKPWLLVPNLGNFCR
jgi:hypothetical protein